MAFCLWCSRNQKNVFKETKSPSRYHDLVTQQNPQSSLWAVWRGDVSDTAAIRRTSVDSVPTWRWKQAMTGARSQRSALSVEPDQSRPHDSGRGCRSGGGSTTRWSPGDASWLGQSPNNGQENTRNWSIDRSTDQMWCVLRNVREPEEEPQRSIRSHMYRTQQRVDRYVINYMKSGGQSVCDTTDVSPDVCVVHRCSPGSPDPGGAGPSRPGSRSHSTTFLLKTRWNDQRDDFF